MRILHATSELYPLVKTGGLADVSAALGAAQRALGHDARVVLPGYPEVLAALAADATLLEQITEVGGFRGRILRGALRGVEMPAYVVDCPALYDRPGGPYLDASGHDYADNALRFAMLSRAAADLALGADHDYPPDVIHGHDWQTGLAPAYLAHSQAARPRSVHTIHNLAYQGVFSADIFPTLGLPEDAMQMEGVEYHGGVGFLKAALWYADALTTVSRTYAAEIQTSAFGLGLEGLLRGRRADLTGIVNGVDYGVWDPRVDPELPRRYGPDSLGGKLVAKAALRDRFGLGAARGPLFVAVARLTPDKGLDLVARAAEALGEFDAQLAILGTGDSGIEAQLLALASHDPSRVGFVQGYDEALAHVMQAGADVTLVPSRTEPCGLTQLYAMRYGSLPLVRRTGGLADTVVDVAAETLDRATGFVFDEPSPEALLGAMRRAASLFEQPCLWTQVQARAMANDFGWESAARRYLDVYSNRGDQRTCLERVLS
ncbi:MAG: glycogen synthase GlgA [Deltaproteobacteria bacterium]|nr:glycogen synthase GlgA [Deltaproteobacteria bacterium]